MLKFPQAINKSFEFFCVWLQSLRLPSSKLIIIDDDYVKTWIGFYRKAIDGSKVKRVTKRKGIGYTTFMSLYLYYYACKHPDSLLVVIEYPKQSIKDTIKYIDDLLEISTKEKQIIDKQFVSLKFANNSKIIFSPGQTYNIRNYPEIDFVFFDEYEVRNLEKLYYDIELATDQTIVKKMILTVTNNLDDSHPDIEKVELK